MTERRIDATLYAFVAFLRCLSSRERSKRDRAGQVQLAAECHAEALRVAGLPC